MRVLRGIAIGAGAALAAVAVVVAMVEVAGRRSYADVALPDIAATITPAAVERGAYLVNAVAHCPACHLPQPAASQFDPQRRPNLVGGHRWELAFGTVYSPNITSSVTAGIGAWSDGEIARVLRTGVRRDGSLSAFMVAGVGHLADNDIAAIIAYLRSQPAVDVAVPASRSNFLGRVVAAFFARPRLEESELATAPPTAATPERGGYLAHGPTNCVGCHSPSGLRSAFRPAAPELAGGVPAPDVTDPAMEIVAPNLTPDPTTGVIYFWPEDVFVQRFRGGRVVAGSPMPWEAFAGMSDTDLAAIWRYLRTIDPIRNEVGPTHRPVGRTVGSFPAP